jgi:hypothetical protein
VSDPCFFGYGSLVNRGTHGYSTAWRAHLRGWRRVWRYTSARHAPYLTVTPCRESEIDGLVATVPGGDWRALDQREAGYRRVDPGAGLSIEGARGLNVQVYMVPPETALNPDPRPPILLSYVDAVLQGYLREFGEEGARRFMATTDGFAAPLLNDRESPLYPRAQTLTADERTWSMNCWPPRARTFRADACASPSLETGKHGLQRRMKPLSFRYVLSLLKGVSRMSRSTLPPRPAPAAARALPVARASTGMAGAALLVLGALVLALSLMAAPARAQDRPVSFADLVESVSPAVVNITTSTTVAARMENGAPQMPDGLPFQDFFNEFFNREGQTQPRPRQSQALGSGFVISPDGFIVTNNHVIEGADEIRIEFFSGLTLTAELMGTDPATDLALLKVEHDSPLPFVGWGDSEAARVGDWVIAVGNPLGTGFLGQRRDHLGAGPRASGQL